MNVMVVYMVREIFEEVVKTLLVPFKLVFTQGIVFCIFA